MNFGEWNELISFGIRIAEPIVALIVVCLSFVSLRTSRRKEEPLIFLNDKNLDRSYPVLYWENSLGRSRSSDIRIDDPTVSRDHAVLLRRSGGWFITDTGSKSGVYVNGNKTNGRCPVAVGDVIALGNTKLVLKRATDAEGNQIHRIKRKYVPSAFILSFITLYISLMALQGAVNLQSVKPVFPAAIMVAFVWIFYIVSRFQFKRPNFELESLALLMSSTGVMMAAVHDEKRGYVQLAATVLGSMIFFFIIWFIEIPDRVMKWHIAISVLCILMLASSLALGSVLNGAKNWIVIGPLSVQPSEFAKIAYIFVGASTLDVLQTKKSLTQFIIVSALSVGLLILMSDFGTALIFFVTFLIISFMRSGDLRTVILAVTAAILGALIMLTIKPYIADRFLAWGHVWEYADDQGYQQVNSLVYSASGGVFGVGLSKGYLQYLFASENDLVFCLICEEAGCALALILAAVIGGLMLYARGITTRSRSAFYSITACSAAGLLVFQTALNIFGVVDILPLTGVTFPFVSYGGSSMAACWGLLAFIKAADERTYSYRIPKKIPDEKEYVEV